MNRYESIAYAIMAIHELQKENMELNKESITIEMLYLMDIIPNEHIIKEVDTYYKNL